MNRNIYVAASLVAAIVIVIAVSLLRNNETPRSTRPLKQQAEVWVLNPWIEKHFGYSPIRTRTAICHRNPVRFFCRIQMGKSVWHVWAPKRFN